VSRRGPRPFVPVELENGSRDISVSAEASTEGTAAGIPGTPGHRGGAPATTNKSGRTPGGAPGGNTIRAGDQRTRYKLKQISRVIIINPRRALIIGPPTRRTSSTPRWLIAITHRDRVVRRAIRIFARKLTRSRLRDHRWTLDRNCFSRRLAFFRKEMPDYLAALSIGRQRVVACCSLRKCSYITRVCNNYKNAEVKYTSGLMSHGSRINRSHVRMRNFGIAWEETLKSLLLHCTVNIANGR